jgi:hypothetical protein
LTQNAKTGHFMRKAAAPQTIANTSRPRTLLEFLTERGGLNDYDGDLQAMGLRKSDRRFGQKIIRNVRNESDEVVKGEGGYGLDRAFQAARDAGYFPELNGMREGNYDELLDQKALLLEAINEELGGLPRYSEGSFHLLEQFGLKGSTEEAYGGYRANVEEAGPSPLEQLRADFEQAWIDFGNDPADLDPEFLIEAADLFESGKAFLPEIAFAMAVRQDYERTLALAIREELAEEFASYDPWHPQWDAIVEERLAERLARADADAANRGGSQGEPGIEGARGADGAPDAGRRQDDARRPTPAELDEIAAAKPRADHTDLPPDPDPRFAEPDGEGIRATTESVWHDIEALAPRAADDPQADFAAPTPEQARAALQARTEGGIRPEGATRAPGEDGGLFDTADTTGDLFAQRFDLGDGKGERAIADIRAEIDTEKSGIDAMRSCLK